MTALLVIALPLVGAVVALVLGRRADNVAALAGTVSSVAALLCALAVGVGQWGDAAAAEVGPWRVPTGGIAIEASLYLDQLSASMLVLATGVAALVQIYSVAYLRGDPRYPSYTALVSVFTSAMALVVASDDLFVLLVGWEVMGACSYFLISHHWELPAARDGAIKAFVMTRLGDIGFLFGIFVLGGAAGTYRISEVVAAAGSGQITGHEATAACLLLLCGVVGKSAQFPLHSWLPDAMPGPTPISALIHAATMVAAGVFLVARLQPVFLLSEVALTVLLLIASVTMLGSALMALAADDLKRVLAWSTVSQLSYMFAALSLGGYSAGVLHLLSHGVFKALLFLAAGSVIHAVGTQRLDSMGGLRLSMPVTFWTMTAGFAALAGIPPLVGFWSKDAVLGVAAEEVMHSDEGLRPWVVLVVGLVVAALTAAYATRAWLLVFFGPHRAQPSGAAPSEPSWLMLGPLVVLSGLSVVGGLGVLAPGFLGVDRDPLQLPVMAASTVLALASAGFVAAEWARLEHRDPSAFLARLRPTLDREFGYDAGLRRLFVVPTWFASRAVMANEDEVVDTYVRSATGSALWGGKLLRLAHNGNLQGYVMAIVVGALAVAVIVGVA